LEPNKLLTFSQYFLASPALALLHKFIYFPIESLGDFGLLGPRIRPTREWDRDDAGATPQVGSGGMN
jgi:hypothetical protein